MSGTQHSIGRLMLVIAGVAGVLAAYRAFGATQGPILMTSLATGCLAWGVARGRPRLAPGGIVGAIVAWNFAVAVLAIGWGVNYVEAGLVLLFLGYPILLGFGLAWCQAAERRGTIRLLAATVGLSLLAGIYLPILGFLIVGALR